MVGLVSGRIVEAITRAALVPEAWQEVTDAIGETFPGTKTGLIGYHAALSRGIPAAYSGYDPAFRPSYETHYSRVIPNLARRLTLPLGHVVHDREIVTEEELLGSEFYNDWLRPQGDARHGAIVVLERGPSRVVTLTARVEQRAAERLIGPVMQLMRSTFPLLRHALDVNRMTLGLRLDAVLLRHGVEPTGVAILLLGEQGSILFANALAEVHLAKGDMIRHDAFGRLRFRDAAALARLDAALHPRSRDPGHAFRLSGSQPPQEVHLMQVTADVLEQLRLPMLVHAPEPRLLLVMRQATGPADAAQRVALRLGITRAEAEVALAITEGASSAEVAQARKVSVETVRAQVKSVLAKTGARRQSDLVRMVLAQVPSSGTTRRTS